MRMTTSAFQQEVGHADAFHTVLNLYTQALFTQISQSSACNQFHTIDQRCARWLLMAQDRVRTDQFPLTQEFLAQMLGDTQCGVSEVAGRLQREGLIQYSRGTIQVINRGTGANAKCRNAYRS